MSSELVLRDHRALQQAVLRTSLAGAGVGLVHALFPSLVSDALALFAIGVAAVPPRSLRSMAVAGALACVAAGAGHLGGALGIAGFGVASALLFARDLASWPRRVLATATGLATLAAGGFVVEAVRSGGVLDGVSPALEWLLLGGGAGFLGGFGVLGREIDRVPALDAADALPALGASPNGVGVLGPASCAAPSSEEAAAGDSEIAQLVRRASGACHEARAALGVEGAGAALAAGGLSTRIEHYARRWRAIERQVARTDRADLSTRLAEVGERARVTGDDVVRAEYRSAERALAQQIEDLDGIHRCHDRAVARLHHHVAVLERLRLAALRRHSAEAGAGDDDLGPLVDEIAAATLDLDSNAEVLELPA